MEANSNVVPIGISAYRSAVASSIHPSRMIAMFYDGISEYIHRAEVAFEKGDGAARAVALVKAYQIVQCLLGALDLDSEADSVPNLQALYLFMLDRLSNANIYENPTALAECKEVVENLREAWNEVADHAEGNGTEHAK